MGNLQNQQKCPEPGPDGSVWADNCAESFPPALRGLWDASQTPPPQKSLGGLSRGSGVRVMVGVGYHHPSVQWPNTPMDERQWGNPAAVAWPRRSRPPWISCHAQPHVLESLSGHWLLWGEDDAGGPEGPYSFVAPLWKPTADRSRQAFVKSSPGTGAYGKLFVVLIDCPTLASGTH